MIGASFLLLLALTLMLAVCALFCWLRPLVFGEVRRRDETIGVWALGGGAVAMMLMTLALMPVVLVAGVPS